MLNGRSRFTKRFRLLVVLTLALVVLSQAGFAKREPKTYPETGKVIGVGTREGAPAHFTHVYKVETDSKIYGLDCNKQTIFPGTGGECGGDKKLKIGDEIHFRTEKVWVYIPVTGSGQTASEQKLRILSEELKPGHKLQDDTRP